MSPSHSHQTPLQSMISGACGGLTLVGASSPFDLVKVRMQSSKISANTSFINASLDIVKRDGIAGLYRGVRPLIIGTPAVLAINLFAYNRAQHLVYGDGFISIDQLSMLQVAVAGFLSSIPTSFVLAPAELVKIRLQVGAANLTAMGVFRAAIKERSIGRGVGLTLLRDCIGSFFYFSVYESIKRTTRAADGSLNPLAILVGGGVSGMVTWSVAIPFDNLKTRVQASDSLSLKNIIASMNKGGWRTYFVGLRPTLIRAFPASAAFFTGVEGSLYVMRSM